MFSYNPINLSANSELPLEDRILLDSIRKTVIACGCRGEEVEIAVCQTLKQMNRPDLLPPCER